MYALTVATATATAKCVQLEMGYFYYEAMECVVPFSALSGTLILSLFSAIFTSYPTESASTMPNP